MENNLMMQTYKNITKEHRAIEGHKFTVTEPIKNDYGDNTSTIPVGSIIYADFAGDFGLYGMTEVEGQLFKVKIPLEELHKINFGLFDARK